MTEKEWLTSESPLHLADHLKATSHADESKLRWLAVACCKRVEPWFIDPEQCRAVEALEQFAAGLLKAQELEERTRAVRAFDGRHPAFHGPREATSENRLDAAYHAVYVVQFAVANDPPGADYMPNYYRRVLDTIRHTIEAAGYGAVARDPVNGRSLPAQAAERKALAASIQDIFGNPFRRVAFNPAWRTSDAVALARGIYEDRAFDRMPILADALQDAGCDSEAILSHCRDATQPHARGCWVVDLVLQKE